MTSRTKALCMEVGRTVDVTYGDQRRLVNLLRSRKVSGETEELDRINYAPRETARVEVRLIPVSLKEVETGENVTKNLYRTLWGQGLNPCTLWEILSFCPNPSNTSREERIRFISDVGVAHAVILPTTARLSKAGKITYEYLWKVLDYHLERREDPPLEPLYCAGYRVLK